MKLETGKEYKNGYGQIIKIVGKQGAYFIDGDALPDRYYENGLYAGPSILSRQNDKFNLMEIVMTHTETPWVEDSFSGGSRVIVGDAAQMVALVYGRGPEEQQANANLIAAAPELLEALKGARTGLDLLSEFSAYKKTAIAKIKEIDAAIAKAEGRS